MNVMTICTPDWVDTHLRRFLQLGKQQMPDADFFVLLVGPEGYNGEGVTSDILDMCTAVKARPITGLNVRNLLVFDTLRAELLTIFELEEGLYIDPDVDILTNISDIPQQSDAELMWVRSPIVVPSVAQTLAAFEHAPTYQMNIGLLYLRRSFSDELEEVVRDMRFNPDVFIAGSAAWNVLLRQTKATTYELPYEYDVVSWDVSNLRTAKVIHFSGHQMKALRNTWSYENFPASITMHLPK